MVKIIREMFISTEVGSIKEPDSDVPMRSLLTRFIIVNLRPEEIRVGSKSERDCGQTVESGITVRCIGERSIPVGQDKPTGDSARSKSSNDRVHNRSGERGVAPAK